MTQDTQIEIEEIKHTKGARIVVIGVGGGGSNMVSHFYEKNTHKDLTLIVANTDIQHLSACPVPNKIQLGIKTTRGLGAGADDEVGKKSALESADEIKQKLEGADMVIICVGLGGGTGTGAAPVVAQIAKDLGALTISISTKPFSYEGKRMKTAQRGFEELSKFSDSNIVVPNDKILSVIGKNTGYRESMALANDILVRAASGISSVILSYGPMNMNVDFADLSKVMQFKGLALMGVGDAVGENACIDALRNAIDSPLFDNLSINGARGVVLYFEMHPDYPFMQIVGEALRHIQEMADEEAEIIWGNVTDENLPLDSMRVTVIATGFEKNITSTKQAEKTPEPQVSKPEMPQLDLRQIAVGGEERNADYYETPAYFRHKQD